MYSLFKILGPFFPTTFGKSSKNFLEYGILNNHDDIYSLETSDLLILSNHFIDSKKLDLISKEFSNQKSNKDKSAFIYTKVDVKD